MLNPYDFEGFIERGNRNMKEDLKEMAVSMTEELKLGCENCQRDCEVPCWKLDHFGTKSADLTDSLQAEVERLTTAYDELDKAHHKLFMDYCEQKKKLAASQARERAAVEAIPHYCCTCGKCCTENEAEWKCGEGFAGEGCDEWQWRGPKEDKQ